MNILAGTIALIILSVFFFLHVAVLFRWIPYTMLWGGRLQNDRQMYRYEIFSVLMTGVMIWIVVQRMEIVYTIIANSVLTFLLWLMAGLFVLNTIGNIASKNKWEKWLFTPLTLVLSACCFLLARN